MGTSANTSDEWSLLNFNVVYLKTVTKTHKTVCTVHNASGADDLGASDLLP